jgi:hypothetical protein
MLLAFFATIAHLISDSTGEHGLHWGSPFTWQSIRLYGWRISWVDENVRQECLRELGERTATEGEVGSRISPLSRWEIGYFLFAVISFTCWLLVQA